MTTICKHCGAEIVKVITLWHKKGEIVFPQYCWAYNDQKHEPLEKRAEIKNFELVVDQSIYSYLNSAVMLASLPIKEEMKRQIKEGAIRYENELREKMLNNLFMNASNVTWRFDKETTPPFAKCVLVKDDTYYYKKERKMPKKLRTSVIQHDAGKYTLWADKEVIPRLRAIPGVNTLNLIDGNRYAITFDPRYALNSVTEEIEWICNLEDCTREKEE